VVLFGDVGERQEVCERAGDGNREVERQLAQRLLQRVQLVPASASLFGDAADALDRGKQRRRAAGAQRLTEHPAQHRHVVAQRLVRIAHGSRRCARRNVPIAGKKRGSFSLA
jgi:hypothetical protein